MLIDAGTYLGIYEELYYFGEDTIWYKCVFRDSTAVLSTTVRERYKFKSTNSPNSIHLDLTALYWSSGAIAQNWLQRFG
eukprot:SAG11_NODE_862_length_6840_cov_35.328586_4_plen_79_part_00